MNETGVQNRCRTIAIPLRQFSTRLTDIARLGDQTGQASMHSRLALIHQTAKQYATEAAQQAGYVDPVIDIDELTNPPLLDLPIDPDDEQQVLIRFCFQAKISTDQ